MANTSQLHKEYKTDKSMHKSISVAVLALSMFGCGSSVQEKQTKACVDDIKLGLNDPGSMEVLSTEPIKMDDGTYRISLEFTAKNAMGGRVRSSGVCGFKTINSEALNPDDYLNQQRDLSRKMNKLGLK
jgi:hypothetical protein